MKKVLSIAMALALLLTSACAVFADAAVPADVVGTPYEEAVSRLLEKGIMSGYDDGTFQVENNINRAEACVIVVRALGVSEAEMRAAADSGFTDLSNVPWAVNYINYAAGKGIVSGVGDNSFNPSGDVTFNEFAAMLINALGYKAGDLTGSWPENYFNKAIELDIFVNLPEALETAADGSVAALRGDVAVMASQVADQLEKAAEDSLANQDKDGQDNSAADKGDEDGKDDQKNEDDSKDSNKDDNGSSDDQDVSDFRDFSDYSGRVYGVILDVYETKNAKNETVSELEVLVGSKKVTLETDNKVSVGKTSDYLDGNLYCMQMTSGVVKVISTDYNSLGAKNAKEMTNGYEKATASTTGSSNYIEVGGKKITADTSASIYLASFDDDGKIDEYKASRLRVIEEGDYVRAYDIVDADGVADVVLVIKAADYENFK